ncbi:MAG: restriction endonuclease subunit S [Lachnospiraceae bacterium]|nr:restriction endonuclease subunit S [Lachnospiraceae bacterium]MCH4067267.1 restriction endonuclease subunit S [Lachnospiraceae bacterium]MCH4113292.1 restriction endonuclease subunit S [Lachnospiraceae bacterium]
MAATREERMWAYMNGLRSIMGSNKMISGAMLVAETKAENRGKDLAGQEAYDAMLVVADNLHVANPFDSIEQFEQAYLQIDENPDWEGLLHQSLSYEAYGSILVPEPLMKIMTEHLDGAATALIAEGEKFVPFLKSTVDAHPDCKFTITSQNALYAKVIERIFEGYENVTVSDESIYRYEFIPQKFDRILSVPAFGVRDLAEDSKNFMCRETEMVALENLLLHISVSGGELVIVMPGRITFAGGHVGDLRKFVTQSYKLEMIAELPDGIFQGTGIKTYLLTISQGETEDVTVRRYIAEGRKTKRGPVDQLKVTDDTFAMIDEIEEIGDWSIDKLLAKQDEDLMRYQASGLRKIQLGEVAQIFRGKSVTKKDSVGPIGVVNISNIGQYDIDYDGMDKIDEDERKLTNYVLQEGDVLLPARGTAIRTAVFHKQSYTCIASSNVIVIRPDQSKLKSVYLKLFLDSKVGNNMISSLQQGMTVMNISYKDLNMMEVPFPVIEKQETVSKEYEEAYQKYTKAISDAEQAWTDTLSRLQTF